MQLRRVRLSLPVRALAILLLVVIAIPAVAAEPPAAQDATATVRAGRPARILLSRLQVGWLAWLTAINSADPEAARAAIERIQAHGAQVEMPYLPEFSEAAAARALEAVAAGQLDRARWALEAAEALDPKRPETAFAAAAVARAEGSWLGWAAQLGRGYARTLGDPMLGQVAALLLLAWLQAVAVLALLAFAGVEMAVKGGGLYRDLKRSLKRFLPRPLVHPLIWVLLLWPLALPAGPLWLALFWGVLLWGRSRLLERLAFALTWVLIAVTPTLAAVQERHLEVITNPGLRALEAAAEGRVWGSLLTEMARLEARMPDSVALAHAAADLERRLGECELARVFYGRVLEREPRNASALADLGLCAYQAGSYERAIQYYQLASESGEPRAEVEFNLSQAYSELYRFNEAESALRAARAIDSASVNEWIQSGDSRLMLPVDGGLRRTPEIARRLREGSPAREDSELLAEARRLAPLGLLFVALALLLRYAFGVDARPPSPAPSRWLPGAADLWRRVLLPGVPEGETDRWGRALLSLVTVAALASLPWADQIAFPIPWGIDPSSGISTLIAVVGLGVFLVARFFAQRGAR